MEFLVAQIYFSLKNNKLINIFIKKKMPIIIAKIGKILKIVKIVKIVKISKNIENSKNSKNIFSY